MLSLELCVVLPSFRYTDPWERLEITAFHKPNFITFKEMFFRLQDDGTEFPVALRLELLTAAKTGIVSPTFLLLIEAPE